MGRRIKYAFTILVMAQSVHSLEEYFTRLWETWPPARFATGLVSSNHETGFLVINISLVVFGFICLFAAVLPGRQSARGLAWAWVVLETVNGAMHLLWALVEGHYVSGSATAPLLLVTAIYLGNRLSKNGQPSRNAKAS